MDNVLMQGKVGIFTFTASEKSLRSFENLSCRDVILGHLRQKLGSFAIHSLSTGGFLKNTRL
jgi:hypothetical protein